MSVMTLVLGKSGTGKNTSIRNLDQAMTALINVIEKPMPFRPKGARSTRSIAGARSLRVPAKQWLMASWSSLLMTSNTCWQTH